MRVLRNLGGAAAVGLMAWDATLHATGYLMGRDEYESAMGLQVDTYWIGPSGRIPEYLLPVLGPVFPTGEAYDLFWFSIHAAAAVIVGLALWGKRLTGKRA